MTTGLNVAAKIFKGEEIDADELVEVAIKTGADTSIKTVTAGTLQVAIRKGIIKFISKATPAGVIANIACVGIENVKVLAKIASGELSVTKGIDQMGRVTTSSMSPEQRSSYENGIWLCRNCAAMIDRDEDYYTVDMLHMWKQLAELEASKNIMGRGSCEEQIALSNNDRCVIDNIIQVVEMGNTSYMLKDFDYHNDFQRDLLSPLFSLMEYLQQPSTKICIINA